MIAVLLGCGLRRAEAAALAVETLQQLEEHWVIADLVGKGSHVRTVPVPSWVKAAVDDWLNAAEVKCWPRLSGNQQGAASWEECIQPEGYPGCGEGREFEM